MAFVERCIYLGLGRNIRMYVHFVLGKRIFPKNKTKAGTYFEMSSLSKIGALALSVLAAFLIIKQPNLL